MVFSPLETANTKNAKDFSLFSVVQFTNDECLTDTSPSGGATHGTCYTSTECSNKKGTSAGKCASGFGICCVFLNTGEKSATITENRTRLRNGEFPKIDAATTAHNIAYTVNKMNSDICQLRLDFTHFVLTGPSNTQEKIGTSTTQTTFTHCAIDSLQITTSDIPNAGDAHSAALCGALTGEHLYIELSPTAADTAVLTLKTTPTASTTGTVTAATAANAQRLWDIKVSQIECFASYRAPAGCDRYLMTDIGQITSYNFVIPTTSLNTGIELASQRVNTCIRRSKGMCCIEYQVCTSFGGKALADTSATHTTTTTIINKGVGSSDTAGSIAFINAGWSIDTNTAPYVLDKESSITPSGGSATKFSSQINIGMVDAMCSGDYVEIPSSWSGACGPSHGSARNTINSRYCGHRFGANFQGTARSTATAPNNQITTHTPVCDCSEPFVVRHNSDTGSDLGGTGAGFTDNLSTARPRGFCLDYMQKPCWN